MQNRGGRFSSLLDVHHHRQRLILDFNLVQGVFSDIATVGDNHGYRLTDVADPVHRTAVILGWNRNPDRKWLRHRCHVITAQNTPDA
jgi:hypothetical protein